MTPSEDIDIRIAPDGNVKISTVMGKHIESLVHWGPTTFTPLKKIYCYVTEHGRVVRREWMSEREAEQRNRQLSWKFVNARWVPELDDE